MKTSGLGTRRTAGRSAVKHAAAIGALLLTALVGGTTLWAQETSPLVTQFKFIPGQNSIVEAGQSVSISGDTAIVGARASAYIFQRDVDGANGWIQVARRDSTTDIDIGHPSCGLSVAISGDTALVGCPEASVEPIHFYEGSVLVFARNQGGPNMWGRVATLTGPDETRAFGRFGDSVAIEGDTVIIGAPEDDGLGSLSGSAYVFTRNAGGAWTQLTKLAADDGEEGDLFGYSVAISGDTVIVGARGDDERNLNAGAAYVFARNLANPTEWQQVQKLTASDGGYLDRFGVGVAIDRDTTVVLAFQGPSFVSGAVYVFERGYGCGGWCEVAKRPVTDIAADIRIKPSVAISGDIAIVGAPEEERGMFRAGAAYVFSRDVGGVNAWGEFAKLTALDGTVGDNFGSSVAISGDTIVVGAASIFNAGTGKAYACRIDAVIILEACQRKRESVLIWDPSVRQTSLGYSCCDHSEFVITATFTASAAYIRNPFFEVIELTGGDVLKNADGGPGGAGATLTPDVGDDGVLSSGESVTVTFIIGLETLSRFGFFVNIKGESVF